MIMRVRMEPFPIQVAVSWWDSLCPSRGRRAGMLMISRDGQASFSHVGGPGT